LLRRAFVIALAGTLGILATPPSAATASGTDLAVELDVVAGLLLPSAQYKVSVTNNGPQALTSATVIVHLDPRVSGTFQPPPCPLDTATATLTCSFGPLATGATAAKTTWVVYNLPNASTSVNATATLTSSTPADPNPANNSAAEECWYTNHYPGFPPYPYRLFC
jgi:hypothetical protein